MTEAKVSIGRIQKFLQTPEHEVEALAIEDDSDVDSASARDSDYAITLSNVTCHWNYDGFGPVGDPEKVVYDPHLIMALNNISANFEEGQLTCILGGEYRSEK